MTLNFVSIFLLQFHLAFDRDGVLPRCVTTRKLYPLFVGCEIVCGPIGSRQTKRRKWVED